MSSRYAVRLMLPRGGKDLLDSLAGSRYITRKDLIIEALEGYYGVTLEQMENRFQSPVALNDL